jgi:hypothetical protein
MVEIVKDEFTYFSEAVEQTNGEPVETKEVFNIPIVNSIWRVLTGKRFQSGDVKLERTIHVMDNVFADAGSILGYLGFMSVKAKIIFEALGLLRMKTGIDYIFEIAEEQIVEHEATFQEEDIRDFTDCFIEKKMLNEIDKEDQKFAKQNLRNIFLDLFLAGSETTSSTLKWAMLYMVLNPIIQHKVQVF